MKTKTNRLRVWLNHVVDVKRKFLIQLAVLTLLLIVSFQFQTAQISNARVEDVEASAHEACVTRVETRLTIRDILFYVVDLEDVLPDNPDAQAYTTKRVDYVNSRYPELNKDDC